MKLTGINLAKISLGKKNQPRRRNVKHLRGAFTLVETLVAIAILLLGVTAAFSSAQLGLSITTGVKDRLTAIFLAQEAIEAVRNIKDGNLLKQTNNAINGGDPSSPDWLAGVVDGTPGAPSGCSADGQRACDFSITTAGPEPAFIPCGTGSCPVLRIDNEGFFNHSTGAASRFTRSIYILEVAGNPAGQKEARVIVNITWLSSSGQNFFTISENIYNWFGP